MKGIALLFTLLIISLIFTISLGVYNLVSGEINLSGTGRESQLAFYAADSGAECALFWDLKHTGLEKSAFDTESPTSPIQCTGRDITVNHSTPSGFEFNLNFDNGSCVAVTVEKTLSQTTITAQGQNTCGGGRTVQRGLKVSY